MKKFQINIMAVAALAAGAALFSGCNHISYISLKADVIKVNVGDELSTELSDYVKASKSMMEQMTLDTSAVDMNRIGTYPASITYDEQVTNFFIEVTDLSAPEITLYAEEIYLVSGGTVNLSDVVQNAEDYSEFSYGFSDDMTLADDKKTMVDTLYFSGNGDYNCEVIACDAYNNFAVTGFVVHVVNEGEVPEDGDKIIDYKQFMNHNTPKTLDSLSGYPTKGVYFGVGDSADEETNRPRLTYYMDLYGDFAVDFIQPDSQYIWLTFNETAEYGNTGQILDILKEKGVSAVFFVTLSYVEKNPELVKRMIEEGHVLGNFTANCSAAADLSVNKLTIELDTLYNYVYETYGYEMYLFRAPSGYFSEQTLAVAQSLGYRTVFWSFAYKDWDAADQPDTDTALKNALQKAHGGAIYMLSGSSTTNLNMLSSMIDGIREQGYNFAVYQKN